VKNDLAPAVLRGDKVPSQRKTRIVDSLIWFVGVSILLLLFLPVGYVSGDTVPLAVRLVDGTWLWNPNRLLMEPTAWVWLQFLSPLRTELSVPDQLSALSMLCGAVSIGVVRGWIAPSVARRRWVANFATAWFALGSAWSIVLLYGYPVMLQMPFLVLMTALLLRSENGSNIPLLAAAGFAGGLAALAWISNALIVASLGLWVGVLAWRRCGPSGAVPRVVIFGGCSLLSLFLPLFLVWSQVEVTDLGFLSWLRAYGGGADSQIAEGYGVDFGLTAMGTALVRTGYGAAMAIVDLSPVATWFRGGEIDGIRIGSRLFAAAMGAATLLILIVGGLRNSLLRSAQRVEILLLIAAWVAPVLLFGFLWDNSDDKFYFQLAIPLAIGWGTMDWWWTKKWWPMIVLACVPLLFNAFDVMDRYVLYDREGKVGALTQAYAAADLVIIPGYEDVDKLSYFVPVWEERRRSITWFADRYAPEVGLRELKGMLSEARESCQRVVVVDIMARGPTGNPWTFLGGEEGYGLRNIQRIVAAELPGLEVYKRAGFTFATWPGASEDLSCAGRITDGPE
jgi:hypothetical protein